MILESMQNTLQQIYDLEPLYPIGEFVFTDQALANVLDPKRSRQAIQEKLLVHQNQNHLDVSLYLDPHLLQWLDEKDPFLNLSHQNLNAFCTVMEGVSHFTYLTWNANYNRPVTQIELELQAEVDKYVAVSLLYEEQGQELGFEDINLRLFEKCRFNPQLDSTELSRYQSANEHASLFCHKLKYIPSGSVGSQKNLRELRRFYRKRHKDKLK